MCALRVDQALASKMVDEAILFCAEKNFSGDKQHTMSALRMGRCEICGDVIEGVGRQIGEYLGQVDKTVKAVYRFGPELGYEESRDEGKFVDRRRAGINLVAWADRKSAALGALGVTLEAVLAESRRKIGCEKATPACYTLDLQIVDDEDVQFRRGYGAIVDNEFLRSTKVWARVDPIEQEMQTDLVARSQPTLDDIGIADPTLISESTLLKEALNIEKLPLLEREDQENRYNHYKTALINRIISDQPLYIDIARKWFTIEDLADLYQRRIGNGKIGGKAAGMTLAARILNEVADEDVRSCLYVPESYFLGSDLIYIFMAMNGLMHWNDQKYKPEKSIRSEYQQIQEEFQAGEFPPEVLAELKVILEEIGPKPLIVRSSSQLEDNFGTVFAGKYDSYFCPNQGSPDENLHALTNAIARTYASTLKPEALLYRRSRGLQDYDERMAVLIQVVQGEQFGQYYLPHTAGVAFSRNLYRWSPEIRREDGFARLVWGLGTRAVGRMGDDYPRLVALSHPMLQPDDSVDAIRRYSQHYVDLIDLENNQFVTLPIHEVLTPRYGPLRFITQLEQDGFFTTPRMRVKHDDVPRLALTFSDFLQRTPFVKLLGKILRTIEQHYHAAVDMEFTVQIADPRALDPQVRISLLQCRPQPHLQTDYEVRLPENILPDDVVLSTRFMVPRGYLSNIRYVLFVNPDGYYSLPTQSDRHKISMAISSLNGEFGEKEFICVGPGRWGSVNTDLGVFVSYADINNTGALVELSGEGIGPSPDPSLGTHFFQDLMEAQIYPLALHVDDDDAIFNKDFFYKSPNSISEWIDADENIEKCIHLIDVSAYRPNHHLEIVMDDNEGQAVAFLSPDE